MQFKLVKFVTLKQFTPTLCNILLSLQSVSAIAHGDCTVPTSLLFQALPRVFDAKSVVCVIYNAQLWLLFCRLICLKGSDFDSKRSLLEEIRSGFPGGSVTFAPGIKNEHKLMYCLVADFFLGGGLPYISYIGMCGAKSMVFELSGLK